MSSPTKRRCTWPGTDPLYVAYHDLEWGVPVHDDRKLFEFLVLRAHLREMVVERRPSTEIKAAALKDMVTILEDGLRKAAGGVTTLEEVLRVAVGEAG